MTPGLRPLFGAAAALLCCSLPPADASLPRIKLDVVCQGLIHSPTALVDAGDGSGRLFIADQRGSIRIFRNGMLEPGAFLDLADQLVPERSRYDERGLLGLAFHPDYANSSRPGFGKLYVFYSAPSPNAPGTPADPVDCRSVVSEFSVLPTDPNRADPTSERILLSFDKPQFPHNGGCLAFGPDNMLYFSAGDGGGSNDNHPGHTGGGPAPRPTNALGNAQDLTNFMGKIHRIDPLGTNGPDGRYGIPATNPFAGSPAGERPEIYAYGLRNCWRFSFDDRPGGTNVLIAADVGQAQIEEINFITPGGNYGWRNKEGSFPLAAAIDAPAFTTPDINPVAEYAHPDITIGSPALPQFGISITGGHVYRGRALPGLVGTYVFADWSRTFTEPAGTLLAMQETQPGTWSLSPLDVLGGNPLRHYIQGFGQDADGELYVLAKSTFGATTPDPTTGLPAGTIFKITAVPPLAETTLTAARDNTLFQEAELSNGAGAWIFAGATDPSKNQGALRRALLAFDLSPLPPGSVVASAAVSLKMDRTISPAYPFSLHRVNADWGEGSSDTAGPEGNGTTPSPADATWSKPFFGQSATWATPGGDYSPTRSATTLVNTATSNPSGIYTWSSPDLASDINAWLAAPAVNFGWLLKADVETVRKPSGSGAAGQTLVSLPDVTDLVEGMVAHGNGIPSNTKIAAGGINPDTNTITLTAPTTRAVSGPITFGAPSAKRFASRSSNPAANRPRLALSYLPPPPPPDHRRSWELTHYLPGQFINDAFDTDADGLPDGIEYAWGLNPQSPNPINEGLVVDASGVAAGAPLQIRFRRDPRATDLTYRLQAASHPIDTWTDLAVSTGGSPPTGPGFQSETAVGQESPLLVVQVTDPAQPGIGRFIRLKIERQ